MTCNHSRISWTQPLVCPYCQLEAQAKEIARSEKFIEQAFIAHPNLDLDIQAAIGQSVEGK